MPPLSQWLMYWITSARAPPPARPTALNTAVAFHGVMMPALGARLRVHRPQGDTAGGDRLNDHLEELARHVVLRQCTVVGEVAEQQAVVCMAIGRAIICSSCGQARPMIGAFGTDLRRGTSRTMRRKFGPSDFAASTMQTKAAMFGHIGEDRDGIAGRPSREDEEADADQHEGCDDDLAEHLRLGTSRAMTNAWEDRQRQHQREDEQAPEGGHAATGQQAPCRAASARHRAAWGRDRRR